MMAESPQQTKGSATEPFELRIAVEPVDIDQLGNVNNVVNLRWVQDAAVAHWRVTAPALEQERLHWVVTRHEIDYRRPALAGDEIVARTWVDTASGKPTDVSAEVRTRFSVPERPDP
jgi:acyl-CoA thioester hydrolase